MTFSCQKQKGRYSSVFLANNIITLPPTLYVLGNWYRDK